MMGTLYENWRESVEEYRKNPTEKNLRKSYERFEEHRESASRSANAGAGRGFSKAKDYKRKSRRD
jgi:hypothetical protein